jgi:serine/threonine protein kinase
MLSDVYDDSGMGADSGGFNPYSFIESYTIEREIGGGAMSRTFEVKNVKLENNWFMKFIPKKYGQLASEVDILKLLNHAGLPRIVDIFQGNEGDYLVETLVEGFSLKEFNKTGVKANQSTLTEWFVQIAQVLSYLHKMNPLPIYHLDLKPGNIMVTHNNRLVLVDFGIARRWGDDDVAAFTAIYAAPEQFKANAINRHYDLVIRRFGDPRQAADVAGHAGIDARTDIYSLGVIMFELATGQLPAYNNMNLLKKHITTELGDIIRKCLSLNPNERYQSADILLEDLQKIKSTKLQMARMMLARKVAAVAASLSLLFSGGTFIGGFVIYNEENASFLSIEPQIISVSLQQSSDVFVSRQMPDGTTIHVDSNQIVWYDYEDNIARIDGSRVFGINEGETTIRGQRRNKEIELTVRVVRAVDGYINVSQQYQQGRTISLFAGSHGRARIDGTLNQASFISPESISATHGGTIYVVDAGEIRVISKGLINTLITPIDYIKASVVRSFENDLYFLSEPWQDGERYYYALCRLKDGNVEVLYIADARYTAVEDFSFGIDGRMYFIDRNEGLGEIYLKTLNLYNTEDIQTLTILPPGSTSLAVDNNSYVYIGNKDLGVIHVFRNNGFEYFAGIEGERAFIDGTSPRFYSPQRLEYNDGYLYIWDFNTLRRMEAVNAIAGTSITIAGIASPDFEREPEFLQMPAEDIILPFGSLMDFTVLESSILLTDYKRGIIWEIDR